MNTLFWSFADLSLDIAYIILCKLDLLIIYLPRYIMAAHKYLIKAIKTIPKVVWWSMVVMSVVFDYLYPIVKAAILKAAGFIFSLLFILYSLYRRVS